MDDRFIEAVSIVAGCSYDEAERYLESESGCYASIGGNNVWVSGDFVRRVLELAVED